MNLINTTRAYPESIMSGAKSSSSRMAPNDPKIMQMFDHLMGCSDQLKRTDDQLMRTNEQLKRSSAQLKLQISHIVKLDKQLRQTSEMVCQQKKQLDEQATQLAEQAEWINNQSTQLIGIQPDLIQLSDLYHEQASKAIELDAVVKMKDNQLADQEETIKQLLTALEASQSKQGLASAISRYFK